MRVKSSLNFCQLFLKGAEHERATKNSTEDRTKNSTQCSNQNTFGGTSYRELVMESQEANTRLYDLACGRYRNRGRTSYTTTHKVY